MNFILVDISTINLYVYNYLIDYSMLSNIN